MAADRTVRELERFLADRADQLMRTAVLLTGSRDAGQDLLQTALERIIRHWRRLDGDPEAYLRRMLYNLKPPGAGSRRAGPHSKWAVPRSWASTGSPSSTRCSPAAPRR
jgi:hypothetical protein